MDRRSFLKGASISAVTARCGCGDLAIQPPNFPSVGAISPEIIVAENKWLLRNGLIQKELQWSGERLLGQLVTRTHKLRAEGLLSDIAVPIGNEEFPTSELRLVSANQMVNSDIASLQLYFTGNSTVGITLHYSCRRGDAVIEQYCVVRNSGTKPVVLPYFDPMLLSLKILNLQTTASWIEGLHDDTTRSAEPSRTYLVRTRTLSEPDVVHLESGRWSSNEKLPAIVVNTENLSYFAGFGWSGEWEITAVREKGILTLQARVADFSYNLAPGESLESPTAFYGVIQGTPDEAWDAIHTHCQIAIAPKTADDFPWVTYSTWYNFGVDLDEKRLISEVNRAADLGIEVFYIDDGWQEGSEVDGKWGTGAGNWTENHRKFPSGIATFAEHVHDRGMKFGLWVEPERVDCRFIDRPGSVMRSWIATRESEPISTGFDGPDGTDGSTPSYQVCFGSPETRKWAIQTLLRVVRDYHVDWLKWDHNMYQPCSDWRHGHQAEAGDWAHTQGVYEVMQALLKEFPDLIIENCAGGGHRFDYGIMRFTRVTWTSDVTEPAHVVRSHLYGASHAYPSQYLTTWYVKSPVDLKSMNIGRAEVDSLFRSRMMGAFGISDVLSEWTPDVESSGRHSIVLYKQLRRFLRGKQAWLTPQPRLYGPAMELPTEWDAVQYWLPETDESVIYAFRAASPLNEVKLIPRFLTPRRRYQVSDEDGRVHVYRVLGETIMRDGVSITGAGINTSAILHIRSV